MSAPLLEVRGLTVRADDGRALVDDVSFALGRGDRLALVGESGSGKSLTSLAILGLLAQGLRAEGSVRLQGTEVVGARERVLNGLRGRAAGVVFQEPLTALDPLMPLGRQVAEPLQRAARQAGGRLGRTALRDGVRRALTEVRLADADRIAAAYPHEVSGGQRQRVAIAMALARRPDLLITDEPTTALDVTVQSAVLDLLDRVAAERGTALLFVSHDLAVVARMAPRALVLQHGRAVEEGAVRDLVARPAHPYTRELVRAARQLDDALDLGERA